MGSLTKKLARSSKIRLRTTAPVEASLNEERDTVEYVEPDTGKRVAIKQYTAELELGRVDVSLVVYLDDLERASYAEGQALFAEQIAAIRQFASVTVEDGTPTEHAMRAVELLRGMAADPSKIDALAAWYARDVDLGNGNKYPKPADPEQE